MQQRFLVFRLNQNASLYEDQSAIYPIAVAVWPGCRSGAGRYKPRGYCPDGVGDFGGYF